MNQNAITVTQEQMTQLEKFHRSASGKVLSSPTKFLVMAIGAFLLLNPIGFELAIAAGLPFVYGAVKRALRNGASAAYMQETGNFAHLLDDRELMKMSKVVGKPVVLEQLQAALEDGKPMSGAALDYLELSGISTEPPDLKTFLQGDTAKALPAAPAVDVPASSFDAAKKLEGTAVVGTSTKLSAIPVPSRTAETLEMVDIASAIANPLKPLIVTAKPRVGKGIIVSHAWRVAKEAYPGLTVWVIQPKPHPKESGYWAGVDRFWGRMVEDFAPNDETIAEELTNVILDWRQQANRPTLLIIDELVKLEACLPKWYKLFIPALLKVEASSGETDSRFLWAITQSPLATDLGVTLGTRNTFEFLTVQKATTIDHAETVKRSIDSIKHIPHADDFPASPVGVLAFHSAANRWMAVPRYDVPAPVAAVPATERSEPAAEATDGKDAAPMNLFDELAESYRTDADFPHMADFIRWLAGRQGEEFSRRNAVLLFGNKRDRGLSSNEAIQPYLDEAVALGLLTETEGGYRIYQARTV